MNSTLEQFLEEKILNVEKGLNYVIETSKLKSWIDEYNATMTTEIPAVEMETESSALSDTMSLLSHEINGYTLRITREPDGRWVLVYENDFGFLKAEEDRYNECIHDDLSFERVIEKTFDWLKKYS